VIGKVDGPLLSPASDVVFLYSIPALPLLRARYKYLQAAVAKGSPI